jgi:hypothetical protein
LNVRRKKRKRLVRDRAAEPRLLRANQEWAMDFIVDGLATGRMVRILSVVDAYTRECLALEADTSLRSGRVTRVLDRLIDERGRPENAYFKGKRETVPVRYELLLNVRQSREEQYATLVHELGHLYCGHLGSPNQKLWPDRRKLDRQVEECEAESISYLVCTRLGVETPSAEYLAGYLNEGGKMPPISLETVIKIAGLIQRMGKSRLPLRKSSPEE